MSGLLEPHLQPQRQHQLLELAHSVRSEVRKMFLASCWVMVEPPCTKRPARQVGRAMARPKPVGSTPAMREETPVLDGEHGVDEMARQQVDRHVGRGAAALGQQRAVARQNAHDRCALLLAQQPWGWGWSRCSRRRRRRAARPARPAHRCSRRTRRRRSHGMRRRSRAWAARRRCAPVTVLDRRVPSAWAGPRTQPSNARNGSAPAPRAAG